MSKCFPQMEANPPSSGGGDVSNIRKLYRPHKKIVSTFFVLIAFLIAFSESYSQFPTPRFTDCEITEENMICNPNQWSNHVDYISYNGCIIEVEYLIKFCTVFNMWHYKMEMVGWRLLNSPACSVLYDEVFPVGGLNEIKAREIQLFLYEAVATKLFASYRNTLSNADRYNNYRCDDYWKPLNAPMFFQAYDGTCMANCVTTGFDVVTIDGSNPSPFALVQNGSYSWVHVANKKCSDNCCWLFIDFCWDEQQQNWKRSVNRGAQPGHNACPDNVQPSELCTAPPRFSLSGFSIPGHISTITGTAFTECRHTCTGLSKTEEIFFN